MANVMTKRGSLDNVVTFEHYCDTVADLQNIPKDQISLGSVAIVLQGQNDELEVYIANTKKQWISLFENNNEEDNTFDIIHVCSQDEISSVSGLPDLEVPEENVIYLVPNLSSGTDLFNEWIYVNDEWEKFGVGTMEIPDAAIKTDIAPIEATTTSTAAHAVGEMFWLNGTLYKATSAIAVGGTITVGTNCEAVVVGDELGELRSQVINLENTIRSDKAITISDAIPAMADSVTIDVDPIRARNGTPSPSNIIDIIKVEDIDVYTFNGYTPYMNMEYEPVQLNNGAVLRQLPDDIFYFDGTLSSNARADFVNDGFDLIAGQKYGFVFKVLSSDVLTTLAFAFKSGSSAVASNVLQPNVYYKGFAYSFFTPSETLHIDGYAIIAWEGMSNLKAQIKLFKLGDNNTIEIEPEEDFYGGSIDLTNGKLISKYANIQSYAGETLTGKWLSSMDVYDPNSTPTTGAQVVYELETPVVYDIDSFPIALSKGPNIIHVPFYYTNITYHQDPNVLFKNLIQPDESNMVASTNYAIGEFFMANGTLYRATAAITAGNEIVPSVNCDKTTTAEQLAQKIPNITYGEPEVVLEETTLNFVKDGDNEWYYAEMEDFNFVDNRARSKFIVEFDGVEYSPLFHKPFGYDVNGNIWRSYFIGNGLCIGMQTNSTPFCIYNISTIDATKTRVIAYSSSSTHTIKISKKNVIEYVETPKEYYAPYFDIDFMKLGSGDNAFGIGNYISNLSGNYAFATGVGTIASGIISHAEGYKTIASGDYTHTEGYGTSATDNVAHAEGSQTISSGYASHAEGQGTIASGQAAHAEGQDTTASAARTHAEGYNTTASFIQAHAEGQSTTASGQAAHAEGSSTVASGNFSHAECRNTTASGSASHAEGRRTIANHLCQHVFGEANIADISSAAYSARGTYVEIVGNGTADDDRSNARALDWSGNEYLAGDVYVGCGTDSTGGVQLARVGDIQVNGTSIISNGVANVPLASSNDFGVVKIGDTLSVTSNKLNVKSSGSTIVKIGTASGSFITPEHQHEAAFYGLAKAAGDATQAASNNAVGTYTDSAKAAIKDMLGITEGMNIIEVSGTTPTITAASNTQYICGEILSLSFTPAATGICDVIFTAGSTLPVVTLPNTVKMPAWYAIEAGKTYEISITNGTYGAVMVWENT